MSLFDKLKEVEKKKINFGCNPCGMQSASTGSAIAEGLGFTSMQPNIFGGYNIFENGSFQGSINQTISGGFNVLDNDGTIDSMWTPNIMGGFDKF